MTKTNSNPKVKIRPAVKNDFEIIWQIFSRVIQNRDTYVFDESVTKEEAYEYWLGVKAKCFVATAEEKIIGMYVIKPNQPGYGSHVSNASFMVDPQFHSKGTGRLMGEHALLRAKEFGYAAMQFNFVVSSNLGAIALWEKLGFSIIGTIPKGFQHSTKGQIEVLIMHRFL